MKRVKQFLTGLSGEFVVFVLGTVLLTAGTWWIWGAGYGLIAAGVLIVGDGLLGRFEKFKLLNCCGNEAREVLAVQMLGVQRKKDGEP